MSQYISFITLNKKHLYSTIISICRNNLTYVILIRNIFMYQNVNIPNHVFYWPQKSACRILLTCRFPKYHTFNISVSNDLRLSFHVPLLCVSLFWNALLQLVFFEWPTLGISKSNKHSSVLWGRKKRRRNLFLMLLPSIISF